jgi:two-component system phosphate regulon response regulator PhoB
MGTNTVAVVDDDPIILEIIEAMLVDTKLEVLTFGDPKIALERLKICDPALVILDYNMPGLSGQSLMIKVSEALVFGNATFVLLSSEDFDDTKKMMLATCGLTNVLKKPLSKKQLMELVESVFPKEVIYGDNN